MLNIKKKPVSPENIWHYACRYVARYACTRQQLARYLERKVRMSGGIEGIEAPAEHIQNMINRLTQIGAINEAALTQSLITRDSERAYGARRTQARLQQRGIAPEVLATLAPQSTQEALSLAVAFAKRRKLGPFAQQNQDAPPQARAKQKARALRAMLAAGHSYDIIRQVLEAEDADALLDVD
jgi:regulatory protein